MRCCMYTYQLKEVNITGRRRRVIASRDAEVGRSLSFSGAGLYYMWRAVPEEATAADSEETLPPEDFDEGEESSP